MVQKRGRRRQARPRRRFGLAIPQVNATAMARASGVRIRLGWTRLVSASLLALSVGGMVVVARGEEYYVAVPQVTGTHFVPVEEVVQAAGVDGLHIFWVDPARVEAAVRAVPNVAEASVRTAWPNQVTVVVTEREPALAWVDGETVRWADAEGHLMPVRGEVVGLLTVTAEAGALSDAGTETLPQEIVAGALQLYALRPEMAALRYTREGGLAFDDARGWTAFFGTGSDMAPKLAVYDALVASLEARGIRPQAIVVDDVRHPYYRLPPPTPTPGP